MSEPASIPSDILPVEPAYRESLRLQAAIRWGSVMIPAVLLDRTVLFDTPFALLLPVLVAIVALVATLLAPQRIYRRLGYALDDRLLRVVRGWLVHTDTVVPFVRVQHIDVAQGPIDKLFGLASLVVHTAGTHNSVVVLPGLTPETAAAIRDRIRAAMRTGWE